MRMSCKGEAEDDDSRNDGLLWRRGAMVGRGGFGSVYIASLKDHKLRNGFFPQIMAVKSAEISVSGSLQKEKEVFNNIRGCPYILKCFGEETTFDKDGCMVYNLLLEYASGGTLAGLIGKLNSAGDRLPEQEVRKYTRYILEGVDYIHRNGYVHCDLKPENILLVSNKIATGEYVPKIGDLGLSKRAHQRGKKTRIGCPLIGGTTMYMSPEAVIDHIQEQPNDVWALGCIVMEMLTGRPAWNDDDKVFETKDLLTKICQASKLPEFPIGISHEARDFLKKCLARNPDSRSTTEMLLDHSFVTGVEPHHDGDDDDGDHNCMNQMDAENYRFPLISNSSFSSWSDNPRGIDSITESCSSITAYAAAAGDDDGFDVASLSAPFSSSVAAI